MTNFFFFYGRKIPSYPEFLFKKLNNLELAWIFFKNHDITIFPESSQKFQNILIYTEYPEFWKP